jgi:hypothetical protein
MFVLDNNGSGYQSDIVLNPDAVWPASRWKAGDTFTLRQEFRANALSQTDYAFPLNVRFTGQRKANGYENDEYRARLIFDRLTTDMSKKIGEPMSMRPQTLHIMYKLG